MTKPRDRNLGMTEIQVRARLNEKRLLWADFIRWHEGKTYAIDSQGRARYYDHDVERFLKSEPWRVAARRTR